MYPAPPVTSQRMIRNSRLCAMWTAIDNHLRATWWRLRASYERATARFTPVLRLRAWAEVITAQYKVALIALCSLLLAALGFAKLPGAVAFLIAAIGAVVAAIGAWRAWGRLRNLQFVTEHNGLPALTGGTLIVRYSSGPWLQAPIKDQLVLSGEAVPNLPVSVSGRYHLPAYLGEIRGAALAYHRRERSRLTYNDLNLGVARLDDEARLHLVAFFDHLCSASLGNDVLKWQFAGTQSELVMSDLFIVGNRLKTVNDNPFPNLIGVSTLGLSTDGYAVLVEQTDKNSSSSGELAPTGSGSLSPIDTEGGLTLEDAVRAGMERELLEETGWPADVIGTTTLVGWGQWAEKGGKPEFFGVTQLNGSSLELQGIPRKLRKIEGQFTGELHYFTDGLQPPGRPVSFPTLCCMALSLLHAEPKWSQQAMASLEKALARFCLFDTEQR